LRVVPQAVETAPQQAPARADDDDSEADDGEPGPADPVAIVERVFRGKRVGQSKAVHPQDEDSGTGVHDGSE